MGPTLQSKNIWLDVHLNQAFYLPKVSEAVKIYFWLKICRFPVVPPPWYEPTNSQARYPPRGRWPPVSLQASGPRMSQTIAEGRRRYSSAPARPGPPSVPLAGAERSVQETRSSQPPEGIRWPRGRRPFNPTFWKYLIKNSQNLVWKYFF